MRRWEKNLLHKNCRFFPWKKTTKNLTSFFHGFFHGKNLKKLKSFFFKVSSFLSFIDLTSRRAVQNRNFDEICNEGRSRFFWTTLLRTHNHESHSISLRLTSKRHAIFCSAIYSWVWSQTHSNVLTFSFIDNIPSHREKKCQTSHVVTKGGTWW